MENGDTKNIEDVKIGDKILSFDFKNNDSKIGQVLNIFSRKVNKIVEYEFSNCGILKATLDHPLYAIDKGWSSYSETLSNNLYSLEESVKKIEVGDTIKFYDSTSTITQMQVLDGDFTVYNLSEIEKYHNYYANNVLVHNRFCFVKGTMIEMADGTSKKIEDVKIDDLVISFNEETKTKESQKVTKIVSPIHDDLVIYHFENGKNITCTFDHPFYVNGLELASYKPSLTNDRYKLGVDVSQIKIGDVVNLIDDTFTTIISFEELEKSKTETFIFEVENNHNFYANGILTHNKFCFIAGTKILLEDDIEKNIEDIQIGDVVLSYNEEKKSIEPKKVTNTSSPIHDDLVEYTLSNGIKITSTFDHPYYVNGLELASYKPEWTNERYILPSNVIEIRVGDFVNLSDNETVKIESIMELSRINTRTYIISVEDNHNFYANKILVHNK